MMRLVRNGEKLLQVAALVAILGLGLAVRLVDLKDAPLDFYPARQLRSATFLSRRCLTLVVRRNRMSLAIEAFVDNVRRYCEWVESEHHDLLTARQLLMRGHASLAQSLPILLYRA